MGVFGLGLYLFGANCSWLVQHYRRNVVCLWALAAMVVDVAMLWYLDNQRCEFVDFWVILLQRFTLGATFGLGQMVLSSTLIIDTCESYQRTEANHTSSWFSRFALSLGPLTGLVVYQYYGYVAVVWVSAGLVALTFLLVRSVSFPFRTPSDNFRFLSLDRFLLPHGFVLFVNLLLVSIVVGLLLTLSLTMMFYSLMMGGFLLALLAQRFVFRDAELKSEVLTGLILLIAALLVMLLVPSSPDSPVPPMLTGIAVGLIASRFLLFFIKLSRHCQRGTAQSTSFLGWESGIALGLGLGYGLFYQQVSLLLSTALALSVGALAMYHFYTHQWFLKNKNR